MNMSTFCASLFPGQARSLLADNPQTFLNAPAPNFSLGSKVCWLCIDDQPVDWGTVIGSSYCYASQYSYWLWCYLILLDPYSPSASWCEVDMAWEIDLEPQHE